MSLLLAFCSFCAGLYLLLASKRFWRFLNADLVIEGEPDGIDAISRDWVVVEGFVDEWEKKGLGERKKGGKRVRWG